MQKKLILNFPLLLIIFIINLPHPLLGQTETEETLLEGQNQMASELLDRLQKLRIRPLDLNRVSLQDLLSLPLVSPFQARNLIKERSKTGPFQSWVDFQIRLNYHDDLIQKLKSYFVISKKQSRKQNFINLRWRHQIQLPNSNAFNNMSYPGSPWKGYQRMILKSGRHFHGSLLLEKDPGEKLWNDHLVGYLEFDHFPGGTRILLGHFKVEFGQGLVLWGPYGYFKGANILAPVKKRPNGILGYAFSDETNYLTGGAIETKVNGFVLTLFASRTAMDATLNSDGTVNTILISGFHLTKLEILKSNQLREIIFGTRLANSWSWGTIGITGWRNRYSRKMIKDDPGRYRNYFEGDQNRVFGLDYDIYIKRLNLFGEIAFSRSGGLALISNSIMELGKHSLVFSIRHFDSDFQNPHAHCFGSDRVTNEEGIYIGFKAKLLRVTHISFYYDLYRKPWRTYKVPVPTRGNDLFIELNQKFSSYLKLLFRMRYHHGETMSIVRSFSGHEISHLMDRHHRLYRLELYFRPSPRMKFKSRLETVSVCYPGMRGEISFSSHRETGFLFYQDVWFRLLPSLTLIGRWITFDTNSYDSRVYEFEGDLPGVLAITPLYGKGNRWYLVIRLKIFNKFQISTKLSRTYHDGAASWGSGIDRVDGNTAIRFGVQADIKL